MFQRAFVLIFLILLLNSIAFALINPVLIHAIMQNIKDIQVTTNTAYHTAFISSLPFLVSPAYLFTGPVIGWMSDKWGRKKLLLSCCGTTCLAFGIILISIIFHNLVYTLLAAILLSAQMATFPLTHASLADISQKAWRPQYMAGLFIACPLAIAVTMRFMDLASATNPSLRNFTLIVGISLIFELIALLLILFWLPETHRPAAADQFSEELALTTRLINKPTIMLLLTLFLGYFAWGLFDQAIFRYLVSNLHFSNQYINALMLTRLPGILFALLVIYPILIRHFSLTSLLFISLGITSLTLFGISIMSNIAVQWLLNVSFGIASAISFSCLWTLLVNAVDNHYYGSIAGLGNFTWSFSWITSNGLIILLDNSLNLLILIAGGIALLAMFALTIKEFKKPIIINNYNLN